MDHPPINDVDEALNCEQLINVQVDTHSVKEVLTELSVRLENAHNQITNLQDRKEINDINDRIDKMQDALEAVACRSSRPRDSAPTNMDDLTEYLDRQTEELRGSLQKMIDDTKEAIKEGNDKQIENAIELFKKDNLQFIASAFPSMSLYNALLARVEDLEIDKRESPLISKKGAIDSKALTKQYSDQPRQQITSTKANEFLEQLQVMQQGIDMVKKRISTIDEYQGEFQHKFQDLVRKVDEHSVRMDKSDRTILVIGEKLQQFKGETEDRLMALEAQTPKRVMTPEMENLINGTTSPIPVDLSESSPIFQKLVPMITDLQNRQSFLENYIKEQADLINLLKKNAQLDSSKRTANVNNHHPAVKFVIAETDSHHISENDQDDASKQSSGSSSVKAPSVSRHTSLSSIDRLHTPTSGGKSQALNSNNSNQKSSTNINDAPKTPTISMQSTPRDHQSFKDLSHHLNETDQKLTDIENDVIVIKAILNDMQNGENKNLMPDAATMAAIKAAMDLQKERKNAIGTPNYTSFGNGNNSSPNFETNSNNNNNNNANNDSNTNNSNDSNTKINNDKTTVGNENDISNNDNRNDDNSNSLKQDDNNGQNLQQNEQQADQGNQDQTNTNSDEHLDDFTIDDFANLSNKVSSLEIRVAALEHNSPIRFTSPADTPLDGSSANRSRSITPAEKSPASRTSDNQRRTGESDSTTDDQDNSTTSSSQQWDDQGSQPSRALSSTKKMNKSSVYTQSTGEPSSSVSEAVDTSSFTSSSQQQQRQQNDQNQPQQQQQYDNKQQQQTNNGNISNKSTVSASLPTNNNSTNSNITKNNNSANSNNNSNNNGNITNANTNANNNSHNNGGGNGKRVMFASAAVQTFEDIECQVVFWNDRASSPSADPDQIKAGLDDANAGDSNENDPNSEGNRVMRNEDAPLSSGRLDSEPETGENKGNSKEMELRISTPIHDDISAQRTPHSHSPGSRGGTTKAMVDEITKTLDDVKGTVAKLQEDMLKHNNNNNDNNENSEQGQKNDLEGNPEYINNILDQVRFEVDQRLMGLTPKVAQDLSSYAPLPVVKKIAENFQISIDELDAQIAHVKDFLKNLVTRNDLDAMMDKLGSGEKGSGDTAGARLALRCLLCGKPASGVTGMITESEMARLLGTPPQCGIGGGGRTRASADKYVLTYGRDTSFRLNQKKKLKIATLPPMEPSNNSTSAPK